MIPLHIAIIMDGNGRWAKAHGLPRTEGHRAGVRAADAIVEHCRRIGIRYLTLYTFSRENWNRPKLEVSLLFDLLTSFLGNNTEKMVQNGIRLNLYGETTELPLAARLALEAAMKKTENGKEMTVNLALNYSGRDEIIRAARKLIEDGVSASDITEETFSARLYSAGQPDPELVVRTSGEWRLSNYLPFQTVYSELYFCDTLWPDFTPNELDHAIEWYQGRERRFGKTSEQVINSSES